MMYLIQEREKAMKKVKKVLNEMQEAIHVLTYGSYLCGASNYVAGDDEKFYSIMDSLGFDEITKKWKRDDYKAEKIYNEAHEKYEEVDYDEYIGIFEDGAVFLYLNKFITKKQLQTLLFFKIDECDRKLLSSKKGYHKNFSDEYLSDIIKECVNYNKKKPEDFIT